MLTAIRIITTTGTGTGTTIGTTTGTTTGMMPTIITTDTTEMMAHIITGTGIETTGTGSTTRSTMIGPKLPSFLRRMLWRIKGGHITQHDLKARVIIAHPGGEIGPNQNNRSQLEALVFVFNQ